MKMPQINWRGKNVDALEVNFKDVREEWNIYRLEDGSEVKLKSVMTEIMRLQDEYDQEGNPIYIFKSTNIVNVKSPDNLKRS